MAQTHTGTHGKHSKAHCYVSLKLLETKNHKMAKNKATLQCMVNTQLYASTTVSMKFINF